MNEFEHEALLALKQLPGSATQDAPARESVERD
jgi:hypothetical protein